MNPKLTAKELQQYLSAWPEGSIGESKEFEAIEKLFLIGEMIGYGRLEQLAGHIATIQLHSNPKQMGKDLKVHYDRLENQ